MLFNLFNKLTSANPTIPLKLPPISRVRVSSILQWPSYSQLKVHWRKDRHLDTAIQDDKKWRMCAKVVKEVPNEPNQVIPLRYLEKRRHRLKLNVKAKTFINLEKLLDDEKRAFERNELLIVEKLCKLLVISKNHVISVDKLVHVKRDFGFPNDFLSSIVPKYPKYFILVRALRVMKTCDLIAGE